MTATRDRARPAVTWTPPLDSEALSHLLTKIHAWEAYDGEALLDDVATVLDEVIPEEEHVEDLAERLRSHLQRLVHIAVAAETERDEQTARVIEQARAVRAKALPGDPRKAVGHLRRLGWTVNELMERLVATRCLKEAA
ncbi:hypothetical protein ADL25_03575 [Streptomyces sp. NRRL F-5122]|uniref:DUF6415 family natural product biosynthesis protein n=1 Tax=Streptomyces sp. NRRL F-5122 TaxID=1609098 RepID=UPI0007412D64|nr:DUF6415 family natural product biosynthesis protein [Streptomyces sp. NRRL F-5122]KUJ58393.1 hypothetical protein ADL25_03575 [Streptomyces sp. NRRL F-5122]